MLSGFNSFSTNYSENREPNPNCMFINMMNSVKYLKVLNNNNDIKHRVSFFDQGVTITKKVAIYVNALQCVMILNLLLCNFWRIVVLSIKETPKWKGIKSPISNFINLE